LQEAEQLGVKFAEGLKASSLEELRKIPAQALLDSAAKPGAFKVVSVVDGYFLTDTPSAVLKAGEQAKVPLLAGWNSAELPYQAFTQGKEPSVANYSKLVKQQFGEHAEKILRLYPAATEEEVMESASAIASDRFINYSTWQWLELHRQTSGKPVYRYLFSKGKPATRAEYDNAEPGLAGGFTKDAAVGKKEPNEADKNGAPHAFEIEYAMGNLDKNPVYAWQKEDYQVSESMLSYFANFIKTGNPNGGKQAQWPQLSTEDNYLIIGNESQAAVAKDRKRYLFHQEIYGKR
jgi:para-nitrobenzyl esterase